MLKLMDKKIFTILHSKLLFVWTFEKLGELCLSGNHTMTEYEMSGEPYSQRSEWMKHQMSEFSMY